MSKTREWISFYCMCSNVFRYREKNCPQSVSKSGINGYERSNLNQSSTDIWQDIYCRLVVNEKTRKIWKIILLNQFKTEICYLILWTQLFSLPLFVWFHSFNHSFIALPVRTVHHLPAFDVRQCRYSAFNSIRLNRIRKFATLRLLFEFFVHCE